MKISYNWLLKHVDITGIDPFSLGERFTMSVAEIEEIYEVGKNLKSVKTVKVVDVSPHPDSKKLKVVTVFDGSERLTIVCGAPNCEAGKIYPLATIGTKLPEGIVEKRKVRGVLSYGMLCSERDLGLSDDHSGLLEFPESTPVGVSITEILPVVDTIFEIDNKSLTHRPDLWGHRGIAREIAVLFDRELLRQDLDFEFGKKDTLKVKTVDKELCPRYTAATYRGVKVSKSPLWLKILLESVGVRSINNVVDITNFVMLDTANPVHAFDGRFISDRTILIRRAEAFESIVTLDGVERKLDPSVLVIADSRKPIALAGIMGGEESEVRDDTEEVVLESANFNASNIRKSAIKLGIRTEASARFEKSLDPEFALTAQKLFGKMMLEIVPGAYPESVLYDEKGYDETKEVKIFISKSFIDRKLGKEMDKGFIKKVLTGLEFDIKEKGEDGFEIVVPSFRATKDISIPEDIVEEIGRFYGYDNIEPVIAKTPIPKPYIRTEELIERRVCEILTLEAGFNETMSYSFYINPVAKLLDIDYAELISLKNPISQEMTHLRNSLVPNLIEQGLKNIKEHDEIDFYESGRVFFKDFDGDVPRQPQMVGGVSFKKHGNEREGFFKVKGIIESIFQRLNIDRVFLKTDNNPGFKFIHPQKNLLFFKDDVLVGYMASIHPAYKESLKLDDFSLTFFELDINALASVYTSSYRYKKLPKFPGINYEISLVVPVTVKNFDLQNSILNFSETVEDVVFITEFYGKQIKEGFKSVSYRLTLRRKDKSMTDEEADVIVKGIIRMVEEKFGGTLRV